MIKNRLFWGGILIFSLLGIFGIFSQNMLLSDGQFHVFFLEAKEGDAIFMKTPEGHTVLIDGGSTTEVLSDLFAHRPFWDRDIDLLVLSHPHEDHLVGAAAILQKFSVKTLMITGVQNENPLYVQFFKDAKEKNIPIVFANKNTDFSLGSVRFDILFPFDSLVGTSIKNLNASSIVLRVTHDQHHFLFPGDLEKEGEFLLLQKGILLKSEVLKVPHQGSRTSSTASFLDAVSPLWGIIPVAEQNRFGHPHQDVVDRYLQKNITLFLTGKGEVEVLSKEHALCIFQNSKMECRGS